MPHSLLPTNKSLIPFAMLGCLVLLLTGCGGGPDDPAKIQALKDLGVLVVPGANGVINGLNNLPQDPAKLTEAVETASKLNALKTFTAMTGVPVTDEHLATIGKYGSLVELRVEGAPITDAGIAKLTGCSNLESLTLSGTGVTSESLASLAKLSKLNMLNLNDTQVSGGFDKLQACPNLQWILIGGLNISDEDAEHISKIPGITHVTRTNRTKISDTAIATLKSIKDCNVDLVNVPDPVAAGQ